MVAARPRAKTFPRCLCRCSCGTVRIVKLYDLARGLSKCCGCRVGALPEVRRSRRFGRWTVLGRAGNTSAGTRLLRCRCRCGKIRNVCSANLVSGASKSCGCLVPALIKAARTTHGMTGSHEYGCWKAMKARCGNPRAINFARYGGRGIRLCRRWKRSFASFLADMGPSPSAAHSIDRKNNDGHYEPGNCRWATVLQQNRNRRCSKSQKTAGS